MCRQASGDSPVLWIQIDLDLDPDGYALVLVDWIRISIPNPDPDQTSIRILPVKGYVPAAQVLDLPQFCQHVDGIVHHPCPVVLRRPPHWFPSIDHSL